ncbi:MULTISPECIES: hypothetical protein [unclassified Oceanispirochaeta]|uniref:hypothetical protein n=1 Tax=unclassified Oceanispirochaeta TaxID=2635722 RepID=UPI000E093565|nr:MULTISPECIES: hypothetical protein [unclassified Oceanispirochaeta]MBF9017843.1 hypothetical protein [Oceanispirochaeta sp. M2]NPD74303.1 hypothetical protein [Oceanispirochaeta sp. M1]RDG29891.1 hypothetical protein DV872_19570 [Oceanispirochaeta sp. M1]
MKKTISIAALVLMSSAALFANGSQEDQDSEFYGRGFRDGGRFEQCRNFQGDQNGPGFGRFPMDECYDEDGNLIKLEEISAEGTLVLEEGTMPYLNTADGKVFLMVPPFVLGDLELEGGEAVNVSGYDMPTNRWGNETESTFMRVLSAEIDGETLDLDFNRMGRASRGGRGGRSSRGGRGNS